MLLHHRQNVENMRCAYGVGTEASASDNLSERPRSTGSSSYQSYSTKHTQYTGSSAKRPIHVHYDDYTSKKNSEWRFFDDRVPESSPRASVASVASTIESEAEPEDEIPVYEPPACRATPSGSRVLAATPADFSELFPSRRRVLIRHDDSTPDGNMNLRLDTEVYADGRPCDMTLFHLRLHDLKAREFSFRRYCRDSGREVCHTSRKQHKAPKRPGFQRSLSDALTKMSIRPKSESRAPTLESLRRNDSGYGSLHSVDFEKEERPRSAGHGASDDAQLSNDTIKLEFSNYAQVDVKRVGAKGSKRYEFEYWGILYAWRRTIRDDGTTREVLFHLTKDGSDRALAVIEPLPLSHSRAEVEQMQGGWIAPCSLQLEDRNLAHAPKDTVDVIVSSGLIALVDDTIRTRFQKKHSKPYIYMPLSKQMGIEYVGPKRLISEMFRRDSDSSQQSRPSSSWRGHSATASQTPATMSRQSSYAR
ncbi:hypothetical protein LTS14_008979 [Recurvomyces mirabilis]|uniref:uncharacterized protein n=1 Tax=Recurvomyces mirabilis TaxID=574656 RepID=UPI002DDEF31D|nr:hypothetical protein LTS14_008979 [Recurvomyces mirabilis]